MGWRDRLIAYKENRENVLAGNINCIPCPFERFKTVWPGIQQGKYYIVTGDTKSGKSIAAIYMFTIWPLWYAYNNRDKLDLYIHYISLEMSKASILDRIISHLLYFYSKKEIELSPQDLNSLNANKVLSEDILEKINNSKLSLFLDYIDEHLTIIETERNTYGIYKYASDLAKSNGKLTYKEVDWKDWANNGEIQKKSVIDKYIPNNPKRYDILITDHIGLITPSKEQGSLYNAISHFSSNDCVYLRNIYNWTICNIHQQSMESQNNDAFKLNRLMPSVANLSDNKSTSKDADLIFGLFNPSKHDLKTYKGYDITKLKKNIRFMEILENRAGNANEVCPLYFNGATNWLEELPKPDDIAIQKYYN